MNPLVCHYFRISNKFGQERGGGRSINIFRRKFFVSQFTVPKILVGESFTVALISDTEKVWRRGGYQDFTSKTFCLTVPKISVGESFTVALISDTEKV